MPASITKDIFMKMISNQKSSDDNSKTADKIQELRYKRVLGGSQRGHIKLKLRTSTKLFTCTIANPSEAKTLINAATKNSIKTRNLDKKGVKK